ncbi:tRNA pseudouridine(55) synthase TruB [Candidatus Peregrinibacteria bacterium]|nr:tRNA pseudouridine(55) synthase TruB [Candidatus Peregrinibacteria bacterium]
MNSILLIDKPSGITSFDVIRRLRQKLGIRKMGHAGTLDPLATGLLIIGLEKATKELAAYMGLPKEYEVLVEFGKVSTTYDAQGELRMMNDELQDVSREDFEKILKNFIGEIDQTPPQFSAIRVKGKRAYDLARRGEKVELASRKVRIDSIEILDWNWPFVSLRVKCGKGTYIRSLAHDIGQKIECGGYVKELRRTAIGDFRVENAQQL